MMKLNPEQQAAVEYLDGALFVLAGAGSGKTRVITEKIAHLITQSHYRPQNIAAITFTNKAAWEMQERVSQRLGRERMRGLTVSTFHALGMKILREESLHIGYKNNFSIFDASDSAKIITEILGNSGRDSVFKAQHQISLWKNLLLAPEDVFPLCQDAWQTQMAQVYTLYQTTLQHYQTVDFDDLIVLPTLLLQKNHDIQSKWQHRLRYLLIDECQDTNACQYELMKLLAGQNGKFTAVGDDDQSIYAWRGANMENLRRLQDDYPQLKVIKLEQNYRSTARILRVANQVIVNNPKLFPKTLWSELGEGDKVRVTACADEKQEASHIANHIARTHLIGDGSVQYSDFAVIYRSNHQSREFEEALRRAQIPYQISGGQSFYDKPEIKDVLAYVRLLTNPQDDPAFLRAVTTPKRGVGDTTLGKLNDFAREHECSLFQAAAQVRYRCEQYHGKPFETVAEFFDLIQSYRTQIRQAEPFELLSRLLHDIDYENELYRTQEQANTAKRRWENVQLFLRDVQEYGKRGERLPEISQKIIIRNLLENKDDGESDAVRLTTLHASKGLEYRFVFLAGCEENILPHENSIENNEIEEERRLMYVGITRAKEQLMITHCKKRRRMGDWQYPEPSRFIDEMPQEDLSISGRGGEAGGIVSQEQGRKKVQALLEMLNQKTGRG